VDAQTSIKAKIGTFERVPLTHLPTRLEELPALSRQLGFRLWVKRDDQTGLAFGGNKARKLEFIMADVLRHEADSIVTWAGVQSNWCRQTAAAAARLGKRSVLVLLSKPGGSTHRDGNLLLDHLLGSEVRIVEPTESRSFLRLANVEEFIRPVLEEEQAAGRKPYVAPVGGSLVEGSMERPLGAIGYLNAFVELTEQARAMGVIVDAVVLASGSSGTQAGLLAGAHLLSSTTKIVGISVTESEDILKGYVTDVADRVLVEIGADSRVSAEGLVVFDDYLKEGYGVLNQEVTNAIRLLARSEGLLLDPVYTGKAMAGLLDLAGQGYFKDCENVVFLHTGGTPALFPYRDELVSLLQS
jgi:D-cysteine desulfhydrase family pyridoxal phosphate-dependent enzyme